MKRRRILQSLAGLPALAAVPPPLAAQNYAGATTPEAMPKITETAADAASDGVVRFFSKSQYAALGNLARLIMPVEADVPAFLDFLLSQTNAQRQTLYREGLDRLNHDAAARYGKDFAALSPQEAELLLAPLKAAWTYNPPADRFAQFLREAKADIVQAVMNSREYAQANSRGRRGAQGLGSYWLPLD